MRRETFSKRGGEAKGGKEFNECIQNTISTCLIPIRLIHPIRVFKTVIRYNKGSQRLSTRKSLKSSLSLLAIALFVAFSFSFGKKMDYESPCVSEIRLEKDRITFLIE